MSKLMILMYIHTIFVLLCAK